VGGELKQEIWGPRSSGREKGNCGEVSQTTQEKGEGDLKYIYFATNWGIFRQKRNFLFGKRPQKWPDIGRGGGLAESL